MVHAGRHHPHHIEERRIHFPAAESAAGNLEPPGSSRLSELAEVALSPTEGSVVSLFRNYREASLLHDIVCPLRLCPITPSDWPLNQWSAQITVQSGCNVQSTKATKVQCPEEPTALTYLWALVLKLLGQAGGNDLLISET